MYSNHMAITLAPQFFPSSVLVNTRMKINWNDIPVFNCFLKQNRSSFECFETRYSSSKYLICLLFKDIVICLGFLLSVLLAYGSYPVVFSIHSWSCSQRSSQAGFEVPYRGWKLKPSWPYARQASIFAALLSSWPSKIYWILLLKEVIT